VTELEEQKNSPGRATVAILSACQAMHVTGTSLMVTISALVGLSLAPDPRMATLPMGFQALAAMLSTLPASHLMKRRGRRFGFTLGALLAASGALTAALAVSLGRFPLLCAGTFLFGTSVGTFQYYRFAAADSVAESERARAISLVLAGGVAAAFLGPNLASWSREAITETPFLASFLTLASLQLVTLTLLRFVDVPSPSAAEQRKSSTPAWHYLRRPTFLVAAVGAVVAYGVMNSLMAATPLAMEARGYMFDHTASVVQWHVVGMFAPAFFSGRLVQRFGTLPMMAAGASILAAGVATHLSGATLAHFLLGLAAIGIGWNFLFVAASTLLTTTYAPEEKATAQGINDLLIYGTVTLTATTAGGLYEVLGWRVMNFATLVPIALVLLLIGYASQRRRTRAQ